MYKREHDGPVLTNHVLRRDISKRSRNAEPPKRKKSATKRWQRKCITSESRGGSARRNGTSCSTREDEGMVIYEMRCLVMRCLELSIWYIYIFSAKRYSVNRTMKSLYSRSFSTWMFLMI